MAAITRAIGNELNAGMEVVAALSKSLIGTVSLWNQRARSRMALSTLSQREIIDIGLDPDDVDVEIGKAFWRA